MKRLRGSDAYTVYSETPTSPFATLKVAIYRPTGSRGQPDREEIRQFIKRNIAITGGSRANLGIRRVPFDLHHPVWVHLPDFHADDHIHETELPSPGDKAQLCDFLSDLVGRPMDHDRPLWEIWVIYGLERNRVAIAFKIHHALADGRTMTRMIESAHAPDAAANSPTAEEPAGEPLPGKPRLIGDALLDLARSYTVEFPHYYRHLQQARRKAAGIRESADKLIAPFSAPFTLLNAAKGGHQRIYRYETFELAMFKTLCKSFDCTINTMIIGVCSEALKRYLQDLNELPAESLVTAMPIGDRGDSSLEQLLGSDIHNNNLAVAILPLCQNIGDFTQRLQAIKEAAKAAIDHVLHENGRRFDNYLDFMPGTAIRLLNASLVRRQKKQKNLFANLVISNVAGPRETLVALDGRLEMEELLSVGNLMDGGNLNITVWSYCDNLAFSFLFRKDAMPEPEKLIYHLKDVMAELASRRAA